MLTSYDIYEEVKKIAHDMDHINEAIKAIEHSAPEKAKYLAEVVTAREETNQEILYFFDLLLTDGDESILPDDDSDDEDEDEYVLNFEDD